MRRPGCVARAGFTRSGVGENCESLAYSVAALGGRGGEAWPLSFPLGWWRNGLTNFINSHSAHQRRDRFSLPVLEPAQRKPRLPPPQGLVLTCPPLGSQNRTLFSRPVPVPTARSPSTTSFLAPRLVTTWLCTSAVCFNHSPPEKGQEEEEEEEEEEEKPQRSKKPQIPDIPSIQTYLFSLWKCNFKNLEYFAFSLSSIFLNTFTGSRSEMR